MSSLSVWLRHVPLTDEQRQRLLERRAEKGRIRGRANRERGIRKEAAIRRTAAEEVGELSQRDLFVAGVIAYAAEGEKRKPWRTSCQVKFINSDPGMIRLFLAWLDLMGIDPAHVTFRVAIHEGADIDGAVKQWADIVGVPTDQFQRTTLKRGNPKTRRRNVGRDYRGCLIVRVRRSGDLNKRLESWFQSVVRGLDRPGQGRGEEGRQSA